MSRANISYHLTQLERSVGMQLMRRTTRRVELTDIGQRLYHHGCVIRNEVLAAKESVAVFGKSLHGAVRLSLPTGFGHMVMSSWLIEFKRLYPDIDLDLLFDNRVDDLLREEVDIAVRVMSEPPQQMVAIELAQVRYVTCASIDYARGRMMPERLEELGDVPLITSAVAGRKLRVSAYQDGEERRELTLHPTLASENFQFLREAILASLGVGLVLTMSSARMLPRTHGHRFVRLAPERVRYPHVPAADARRLSNRCNPHAHRLCRPEGTVLVDVGLHRSSL